MLSDSILNAIERACRENGRQVGLARATGVSQGLISAYLSGRKSVRNMSIGILERLLPALNMKNSIADSPGCNIASDNGMVHGNISIISSTVDGDALPQSPAALDLYRMKLLEKINALDMESGAKSIVIQTIIETKI